MQAETAQAPAAAPATEQAAPDTPRWRSALGRWETLLVGLIVVLRVPSFWQQAIVGALLIGAIALDRLLALRIAAALRQRSVRSG